MTRSPKFVLFSGHNDRAVIALARFFTYSDLRWAIIAAGSKDAIHRTRYRDRVVFNRLDKVVDFELFTAIASAIEEPIVICPTTEFINQFLLDHRDEIERLSNNLTCGRMAMDIALPSPAIYKQLTEKYSSQQLVKQLVNLDSPQELAWPPQTPPCVLKPRKNVAGASVLYPKLCFDESALRDALQELDPASAAEQWFAQTLISGQSYYLCGYLARSGERAWYWQENLLQQLGGKSIVLARTCADPGLDADTLFDRLNSLGYHGPLMMEVIRDHADKLHYIEINPRFWGPLQLALSACPRLLVLFAEDHGAEVPHHAEAVPGVYWYAWAYGATLGPLFRYPAAAQLGGQETEASLLLDHDVYGSEDSQALHGHH